MMNADLSTLAGQRVHYSEVKRRIAEATPKLRKAAPLKRIPHTLQLMPPVVERWPIASCGRSSCEMPPRLDLGGIKVTAQSRIRLIQQAVAHYYGLHVGDLVGQSRTNFISFARQIAFYFARTRTDYSFSQIGKRFGGRDHSSILHGVCKIKALIESDPKAAADVAELEKRLSALL